MSRLAVLHVITDLRQGGAEAMLEKLILTSKAVTPEIHHRVVSLRSTGTVGPRLIQAGISVDALGATGLSSIPSCLRRLAALMAAMPQNTIVQTWLYHADLLGGLAAKHAGRKTVWNIRQTGLGSADIGWATRAVVRTCGLLSRRIPARVLCNSSAAIAVHERMGYDTTRFRVIPNGFDTTRFARDAVGAAQVRSEWGLSEHEVAVGLVARHDPQKDHATFIQAAAIANAHMPRLRYVLVGRDVPESVTLRTAIAQAGLAHRFVLDGERTDIARVMSALDVFCLSSRAEGFPNVLGEAMACETPAISTDCGDARIILGDDAHVSPIQDPAALASRILAVATLTTAQRRKLGALQRERIVQEFDIRQVWNTYLALYRELVDTAPAGSVT